MKKALLILLVGLLTAPIAHAGELDDLLAEAMQKNENISAMEHAIAALDAKITQAGAWMDPMIAVEYSNLPVDSFEMGEHPMSGVQYKLQQTIPFPGKKSRGKDIARGNKQVRERDLAELRNQLRARVRVAYWRLTLTRELEDITREHIFLTEQLIVAVRIRYEVGGVDQHNLIRLTVLRDKLRDDIHDYKRAEREWLSSINAILHRDTATPVPTTSAGAFQNPPPGGTKDLVQTALEKRPSLARWRVAEQTQKLAARDARLAGVPDLTLWVGYRQREEIPMMDEGVDFLSVGASVKLPIFYYQRWWKKRAEHLSRAANASAARRAAIDEMQGGIESTLAAWERAAQKALAYAETLEPGAQDAYLATLAAYQVGRADFASLYQAQLQLLRFRKARVIAGNQTRIMEARVRALVGEE